MDPVERPMKEQFDEALGEAEVAEFSARTEALVEAEQAFEESGMTGEELKQAAVEAAGEEAEMVRVRPRFPLSIAVVGAPGSGKADFVEAFTSLAAPWFAENGSHLRTFPNPGTTYEGLTGQAVGFFGGFREDLTIGGMTILAELKARNDGVSFVTNGTLLSSMAHAGANFEAAILNLRSSGLVTPETQLRMQQAQAAMAALSLLMSNLMNQFIFQLPLAPIIEIPGQEATVEQRHAQRVNNALDQVLAGFNMDLQKLESVGAEERAAEAFIVIKNAFYAGVEVRADVAEIIASEVEPVEPA
jgi:hypothetical protein